jgi:lipid-A-disaccharide synthase
VALPTLPHLAPRLVRLLPEAAVAATESERRDAIAAADAALVASGTATLELAAAGVPMVVGYRAAPLTVWAARRLLRLRHIALPNILTEEVVVPELIQGDCTAGGLATAVAPLLAGGEAAAAQRRGLAEAVGRLGPAGSRPSRRAAAVILSLARPASPPQIDRGAT